MGQDHPHHDPDDQILVEDLETFRVIDNPLRQRIMHLARRPRSVKELAERLGVPVTRLYYHVNMLESAGLMEVEEVRKSGAQLERVYRSVRGTVVPSPDFVDRIGDPATAARVLAGALFDNSRGEVEATIEKDLAGQETFGVLARMVLQLDPETAAGFAERIEALAGEIRAASQETENEAAPLYTFTYAFVAADPA